MGSPVFSHLVKLVNPQDPKSGLLRTNSLPPLHADPPAVLPRESPVVRSLREGSSLSSQLASPRCSAPAWSRYALLDSLLRVLTQPLPRPIDVNAEPLYRPQTPAEVPACFPDEPLPVLGGELEHLLPLDVALFAFARKQNCFQQYLGARSLKNANWALDVDEHQWYSKSGTPHVGLRRR